MAEEPTNNQLTGYELSRNWFDWCYENPDLISPTHTAMYFFIIDHWNRLGQKDKFGLPMEMTKDALGIKNYRTFSKVFNNLIDWGFIKILQRSKNQYSANVIAIAKNTKANTKALTKAMQKQLQKQVHGIVGVIEPNNKGTIEPINSLSMWRENFEIYLADLKIAYELFLNDEKTIKEQEEFNPNLDIKLTAKKAFTNFWGLPAGWKNKKTSKTRVIDWKETFINSLSQQMNKVYKSQSTQCIPDANLQRGLSGNNGVKNNPLDLSPEEMQAKFQRIKS